MKPEPRQFVALVLAADRETPDPVAQIAGVACKALVPVGGRAMILRVLKALSGCNRIGATIICGPDRAAIRKCPDLEASIGKGDVSWVKNQDSPSRSAEAALAQIDAAAPVLLTTADHALLRTDIVDYFLDRAAESSADAAIGLVGTEQLQKAFPGVRRTVFKLRDGSVRNCNLFALLTPRGRGLVSIWHQVEQQRKRPWRIIAGLLGIKFVWSYQLRRLSLAGVIDRVSARLQIRIQPVMLPYPEAGIDVDTPADLALARDYCEAAGEAGASQST